MRYYLSPSLMCMDMMKLTEQLRFLNSKADRLHVDIMDGHYVKNLALSASFVAQIRPYTSLPIDVHLMVEAPVSVYTGAVRRRRRRLLTASGDHLPRSVPGYQYASSGGERGGNGAQSRHTG